MIDVIAKGLPIFRKMRSNIDTRAGHGSQKGSELYRLKKYYPKISTGNMVDPSGFLVFPGFHFIVIVT